MPSFIKTYTLTQQTPMIHFQYDQPGATLRATEVKPKLDRFICKKHGGAEKLRKEHPDWFGAEDQPALNYKLRVVFTGKEQFKSETIALEIGSQRIWYKYNGMKSPEAKNEKKKLQDDLNQNNPSAQINGMYFANMVAKGNSLKKTEDLIRDSYKETVFYPEAESTRLQIVCFIPSLLSEIEGCVEEFFLTTNFGTRQSKGFGGFLISGAERKIKDPIRFLKDKGYRFFYTKAPQGDAAQEPVEREKRLMDHAMTVYAVLKGGLNLGVGRNGPRYFKSYVQRRFLSEDQQFGNSVGSEKSFIKKEWPALAIASSEDQSETPRKDYDKYVFIRALLGVADRWEYRFRGKTQDVISGYNLGENDFDVVRFKSPITVKIVDSYIIFLVGSFDDILGKTFYFLDRGQADAMNLLATYAEKKEHIEKNGRPISTPDQFTEEDVKALIAGFCRYYSEKAPYKLASFPPPYRYSANLKLRSCWEEAQ